MKTYIFVLVTTVACLFCTTLLQAQNNNDINNFTRVWDGGISGAVNPSNPNGVRNLGRSWELEAGFDLDDDGLKEFAAYDATDNVFWVWENIAHGVNDYTAVYTIPAPAPLFEDERSILITDMDHDGNKELVVIWDSFAPGTPNGFDALQVYEHVPGSGEFLPATPQLTFDPPRNLDQRIALEMQSQAGDFDLDGNVEIVLTYRGAQNMLISVLEFTGADIATGSFNVEFMDDGSPDGSSGNPPADINRVHGLGVGDLNGDNRPDFVMVPDTDPVEIRVYTTIGPDAWSMTVFDDTVLPSIYVTARGSNATPAIADFNSDGFNEVYIIGRGKVAEDPTNKPRLWVVSPLGGGLFDLGTAFNAANFTDLQVAEIVPPTAPNNNDLRGGFVADGDNDSRLEVYILSRDLTTIFATEWVGNPSGDVSDPSNYQTTAIYNSKDFTSGLNVQFSNIKVFDLDDDGPNHLDIVFTSPGEHEGLESSIFVLEYDASELLPPDISVSPASFEFNLNSGDTTTAVMTIDNLGEGVLDFSIRDDISNDQKLYWTVTLDSAPDTLYRSNLDGTDIDNIFIGDAALAGIVVDEEGGRVYWVDGSEGSIRSSSLDGSDVQVLVSGLAVPVDIAIDTFAGKVYWTDFTAQTISRANLDGSGVEVIIQGTAVASQTIVMHNAEKEARGDGDDGSKVGSLLLDRPWGIALDLANGKVYWTEQNGGRIGRANLDGTGVETIITTGLNGPRGIKLEAAAGKIYFVDSFNNSIKRANLDGTGVETLLSFPGNANPLDIELDIDSKQFYWSDNILDRIQRANFDGSNVEVLIENPVSGFNGPLGVGLFLGRDWLSEAPLEGTVPPGSSEEINIKVDAANLNGGEYQANIFITSNDPIQSEVIVPVTLTVTGAPNIALSNTLLNYGSVFIGESVTRTLMVSNRGTALLTVGAISSDNSNYTVDLTSFSLNPGESQDVAVTFMPSTQGEIVGTLTINSDDPDESIVTVALQGEGVLPPDISVTPDSLSEDLFTGETSTQMLTISNTGASDLSFDISVEEVITATNASMSVKGHTTLLDETRRKSETTSWDKRRRYTFAELRNLWKRTGNILSSDMKNVTHSKLAVGSANTTVAQNWQLLYTDPDEADLTYDIESVFGDVTSNELLIKLESYVAWSDPVGNGIALIFIDADQDTTTGLNSEADDQLGWNLGIEFAILRFGDQADDGLHQWNDNFAAFEKIDDLITNIVEANSNLTIVGVNRSYFETFSAVNLAMIAGSFNDPDLDSVPDIGAGHITFSFAPSWIRLNVTKGVIPAGSQEEITVTFDATGLNGGDYDANIVISSDDPDESEVIVPAHLQVTGAPDIAVSNDTLDYGPVFLGAAPTRTLSISNVGTDLLTVNDISSDNSTYTVDITSFSLNPGESQEVLVTFTPNSTGVFSGILTITSDDPDESTVTVALQGEGLLPPDISVSPDSLSQDLFTGETSTQMLTISNTGASDLSFDISIEEVGAPGVSVKEVNTNKRYSEHPQVPLVEIRKGEKDTRVYPLMRSGSGGPDTFGYSWEDSNEPGGPIFNWVDASGGTPIFLDDDDFVTGIPLGFTFTYYGIDFTEIGVGANGWLSFNGFDTWFPSNVPAIDEFEGAIAPFASDLFPPNATYIHYQTFGVAPNRYFVVEYNSIPDCCGFENPKTFEVIFYEGSNTLRFQYLTVPDDPVAIGIESPDQTIGMGNAGIDDLFISPELVEDNYAIEFTLQPGWLTVNPSSGTVPPGSSLDIEVTFDATGLIGGDYDANIVISSNDPDESEVVVPAHLHAEAPPTPVEEVTSEVPISFSLHQNYPNPFNPTTTIQFALPKKSEVKLKLFDVLGRRVATLVDEELEAGEYRVNFEAEGLPSGVYFYRIETEGFVRTRKFTLLK